jgi:hypothetical protein
MTNKVRIDITVLDSTAIRINEDSDGAFLMIGKHRAYVPPQHTGKRFNEQEVISFFIERIGDIGVGIIVYFLCDLLQRKKIKNIKINNKAVGTEDEIKVALDYGQNNQ